MPSSLYKYFSNTVSTKTQRNHSLDALENNTVYLQNPMLFDDPYDCTIVVDEQEFAFRRITYYAGLCGLTVSTEWNYTKTEKEFSAYLHQGLDSGKHIEKFFPPNSLDNSVLGSQHMIFMNNLKIGIEEFRNADNMWSKIFYKAIHDEYTNMQKVLIHNFRVSCFSESPYSMLMWSHYANSHMGFCIEYEIPPYTDSYVSLFHNLFPVIYSDERTSVLDQCIQYQEELELKKEILWDLLKYGLLTKSMVWKYQNEWRLISYGDMLTRGNDFNCRFFDIKKVYLGSKMSNEDRIKVIEICKRKHIPYVDVIMSQS